MEILELLGFCSKKRLLLHKDRFFLCVYNTNVKKRDDLRADCTAASSNTTQNTQRLEFETSFSASFSPSNTIILNLAYFAISVFKVIVL